MSLSLIARRLPGLNVAQRAVSQLLPTNLMAGTSSSVATQHEVTVPSQAPLSSYNLSPFTLQRQFSSINISTDDDDGGSVSPPNLKDMTNEELQEFSSIPGWNLVHNPPRRNTPKGALVGKVVSDKMQKTVNVAVDRYRIVPKYRKRLRYTKKFMAHDEFEVCNMGDLVMIVPCQKISRHKHFMVREIIRPKGQL